ncbi:MAG TPA: hypothetical protein VFB34_14315 [Chloroflexota bacterium]|nr:hypothetical protein [Chloroflexota bacterium]
MAASQENASRSQSISQDSGQDQSDEQRGLVRQVGPLDIAWPKALGYYGGLGLAIGFGLLEPPIAVFIAAVPFFKMLNRPDASQIAWTAGEILDGAATPVGGSSSPVIRTHDARQRATKPLRLPGGLTRSLTAVWRDAERIAR